MTARNSKGHIRSGGEGRAAWPVLILSAVAEAVWATALGASDGFTRPVPTVVFGVFVTLSMVGLGWAMRRIPLGTAYAVWVGLGAALTVTWAVLTGNESLNPWKVVFLIGILGAVIGLKFVGRSESDTAGAGADPGSPRQS